MPNSAAFLAKVAEKPKWMTAQEKAKTFAGPGGWYMKNGNPAAAPELIETIPGLSSIIDFDSAGAPLANVVEMIVADFSFTRRSRRGFNLVVGLQEQLTNTSGGGLDFQLSFDPASSVLDASGNPDANWTGAPVVASVADGETFGRLVFQLPLLTEPPSQMMVKLLTTPNPPLEILGQPQPWTGLLADAEGNDITTLTQTLLITDPGSGTTGAELIIVA